MNGDTSLYTIGELARRTGLPVRTIRFYADEGVVPPTERTPAGYRVFDAQALARLDLVRTLRELGVDLETIRRVLAREVSVADVAAAHAEAVEVQIRALRMRRAVLRTVAAAGCTQEEMRLMHKLTKLTEAERQRLVDDFLDDVLGGGQDGPVEAMLRSARPSLPDDPSPQQVSAWVELAELTQDPDFRARIRGMSERAAADRAAGLAQPSPEQAQAAAAAVLAAVRPALEQGIDPASPAARPALDQVVAIQLDLFGQADTPAARRELRERLAAFTDRRAERYWELLATINGWPRRAALEGTADAYQWVIAALAAHAG